MTDAEIIALVNVSTALVAEAVDSRDSAACMQGVGGVAAVLNVRATAAQRATGTAAAVRERMLVLLDECMAMTELTRTTVTQTAGTLASIAANGGELSSASQRALLGATFALTTSAARLGDERPTRNRLR